VNAFSHGERKWLAYSETESLESRGLVHTI